MNRISNFIFGSKQQTPTQTVVQTVEKTKLTIEETIRRYEQLSAK